MTRLCSITLESVLGAPDGTLELAGDGGEVARVVHLRGPSGCGKSSVLRAIAAIKEQIGAYGASPRPSALRRKGARTGRIAATWSLPADELATGAGAVRVTGELLLDDDAVQPMVAAEVRGRFATWDAAPRGTRVELIPAARGLVDGAGEPAPEIDLTRRVRGDAQKYAGLASWLAGAAVADGQRALRALDEAGVVAAWDRPDALRGVRAAIAQLLPHLRLVGVEPRGSSQRVVFVRDDGASLDLFELSTAERDAVLLALVLHAHALDGGVIVIDEPFATLEPSRHAQRLATLANLVPAAQLIVASSGEALRDARLDVLDLPLGRPGSGS